MAETVLSFADIVRGRKSMTIPPAGIDVKVKTGAIACLRLFDGPPKCTGVHCTKEEKCCKEKECFDRLRTKLDSQRSENATMSTTIDVSLIDIDELLNDISVHCRTDSLYQPAMEESSKALEEALVDMTEHDEDRCECVACDSVFQQKECKVIKARLKAAENRLTALSEYRRAKDKAALERTNEGYMKNVKYFTPVGGAKAKGVKALRPTLQLQNSYDVAVLTTNSMEERPLVGARKKKGRKGKA